MLQLLLVSDMLILIPAGAGLGNPVYRDRKIRGAQQKAAGSLPINSEKGGTSMLICLERGW